MELVRSIVVPVAFVVAAFVVGRGGAVVGKRCYRPDSTIESVLGAFWQVGYVAAYGGAFLLLLWQHPIVEVLAVLGVDDPSTGVVAVLVAAGMAATAFAAGNAFGRGQRPLWEQVRTNELTTESVHRWYRYALQFGALSALAVVLASIAVDLLPIDLGWFVPVVAAVGGGYLTLRYPLQPLDTNHVRDPTEEERDRIERAYDRFDRSPGKLVVYSETDSCKHVEVAGHGPVRFVWIRSSLLETVDDDELAAALAQADERCRRFFIEYGLLYLTALLTVVAVLASRLFSLLERSLFGLVGLLGLLVAVLVGFVLCRGGARRATAIADRFACDALGADLVRSAYRRLGPRLGSVEREKKQGRTLPFSVNLTFEPRMEQRIERIEAAYGLDPVPVTFDDDPADGGDPGPADDAAADADLLAALRALDDRAFGAFVADLWAERGWQCSVSDDGGPGVDVRATGDGPERELVRTVQRRSDDPITSWDLGADDLERRLQSGRVDSVVVVTTGQFEAGVEAELGRAGVTLVDGQELCRLVRDAADERLRSAYPRIGTAALDPEPAV